MKDDFLTIADIRFKMSIGVLEWELRTLQEVELTLNIFTNFSIPASTDDINDCVEYASLSKKIEIFLTSRHFNLIETAVEEVAKLILEDSRINATSLELKKFSVVTNTRSTSAKIYRSRI
jgi:dihydroneopterin aldolase